MQYTHKYIVQPLGPRVSLDIHIFHKAIIITIGFISQFEKSLLYF